MTCHAARQLDLLGYKNTVIHRIDSRIKIISALVFIVTIASFPKYSVSSLIPFFLIPVMIVILGNVPLKLLFRIIFYAAPFAIMVGAFNPVIDRNTAFIIFNYKISFGFLSFISIVLRFLLSITMILAVAATTSMNGILNGMLKLKIPKIFVTQIHFLYRYLFELLHEGEHMTYARRLKEPKRKYAKINIAIKMLSVLFIRTWRRSEMIYNCMVIRGFDGEFPFIRTLRIKSSDMLFLFLIFVFCFICRFLPVTNYVGQLFIRGVL